MFRFLERCGLLENPMAYRFAFSKVEVAQALQDRSVNSTIPMWVRSPSLLQVYGRQGGS